MGMDGLRYTQKHGGKSIHFPSLHMSFPMLMCRPISGVYPFPLTLFCFKYSSLGMLDIAKKNCWNDFNIVSVTDPAEDGASSFSGGGRRRRPTSFHRSPFLFHLVVWFVAPVLCLGLVVGFLNPVGPSAFVLVLLFVVFDYSCGFSFILFVWTGTLRALVCVAWPSLCFFWKIKIHIFWTSLLSAPDL